MQQGELEELSPLPGLRVASFVEILWPPKRQRDARGSYAVPEFRKLFDLPGAKLRRADIEKLGRLISEGILTKPEFNEFCLFYGDETHRASSAEELMAQDLPQSMDGLSFRVVGWSDNNIDRGVSLELRRTHALCQIHSVDEVWFRGKIQQVTDFFKQHRPWYEKLHRQKIAALFGVFQAISYLALGSLLVLEQFLFAILAGLAALVFIKCFAAFQEGRLFPLIDIQLSEKPRRLSREVLMVVFTGTMAVAAVATILIQIMQMVKP